MSGYTLYWDIAAKWADFMPSPRPTPTESSGQAEAAASAQTLPKHIAEHKHPSRWNDAEWAAYDAGACHSERIPNAFRTDAE